MVKERLHPTAAIKCFCVLLMTMLVMACQPRELASTDGFLTINGSEIYYKTLGEGEPLVIVHGGPTLEHSYFLPHFESLAEDFQLIFYDQRASGKSSIAIDSSTMNLSGFIEDIELIRKQLGLEKINLLGHSWGGLIAMGYGTKYSNRLKHLVLSNSMASNVQDWQAESAAVANLQTEEDKKERQDIFEKLRNDDENRVDLISRLLLSSFKPQMFDRGNLDLLNLNVPDDIEERSRVTGLLAPDMNSFNFDRELKNIKCPTLLIYGEMEPAIDIYANKMTSLIPGARLEIIESSGHFPFIEQPNKFNLLIKRFIK